MLVRVSEGSNYRKSTVVIIYIYEAQEVIVLLGFKIIE